MTHDATTHDTLDVLLEAVDPAQDLSADTLEAKFPRARLLTRVHRAIESDPSRRSLWARVPRFRTRVVVAFAITASLSGAAFAAAATGDRRAQVRPNMSPSSLSLKFPALDRKSGVAPRSMGTLPSCTSDARWSIEGTDLVAFEQTHPTTNGTRDGTTTVQTPYAYSSLPFDFTGDGTYTVDFGPLPSSFDPSEWAYQTPNDFEGTVWDAARASLVSISGSTYDQARVTIESPSGNCGGLTIWIY
jgi:hypothetical protein